MDEPEILAIGEPLVELVRLPDADDAAPLYRQNVGGDVLNAVVAAARQGGSAGLMSAIGSDAFGRDVRALCDKESVHIGHLKTTAGARTGVNFVTPDPAGRRFDYMRAGSAASLFGPEDLSEAAIARARVLHVSSIGQAISGSMRAAIDRAADVARQNKTLVSYDVNLRLALWTIDEARAEIERFLPNADIVWPTDDEAEALTGQCDVEAQVAHFGRYGARIVGLKRGAKGAVLATPDQRYDIAAVPTMAVDSTGAGDGFAGAFLAQYLATTDIAASGRVAAAVASRIVSGVGAL